MRWLYKFLIYCVNKNWRWEESRAWLEGSISEYHDGTKEVNWEGFWYLVVHIYHKDDNPKMGIQIDCGSTISRWRCFKILLKQKDKVTVNKSK